MHHRVGLLVVAFLAAGCGGYVGRARRAYSDGRYLEAAERLGQHEQELSELSPKRQAEYGLYRGLSLLRLGDLGGAHQWMSFTYAVERQVPGALRSEDRGALDRGWAELGMLMARQVMVVQPVANTQ